MKNAFTRLTAKTLKANRTRTMVTIIGILLATAMLTAVTTFISSLQHYMLENVIAENGDWHGEAMQIPEKKVEELAGMKEVTMQVTWQELGYALNGIKPSYHNSSALPYYYVVGIDADFEKQMPIRVTEGRLPENDPGADSVRSGKMGAGTEWNTGGGRRYPVSGSGRAPVKRRTVGS